MVGMIFTCKSIPSSTKFFVSMIFQSFDYGILGTCMNRSWIPLKYISLNLFFNWLPVWYSLSPGFLPNRCIVDSLLFLFARNARTCSRVYQCSNLILTYWILGKHSSRIQSALHWFSHSLCTFHQLRSILSCLSKLRWDFGCWWILTRHNTESEKTWIFALWR